MKNSNFLLCVLSVAFLLVSFAASQATAPQSTAAETAPGYSKSVREHMQVVQAFFDKENADAWYRLAFVAEVTEIRLLKPSDKIFEEVADAATQVAVLRVRVIGRANEEGIKDTSVIVVPIGESRELWQQRIDRRTEMVFEYNRIGKREFVMKFGC